MTESDSFDCEVPLVLDAYDWDEACGLSDDLVCRVHDLLEHGAVLPLPGTVDRCIVRGRTGVYTVRAYRDRVECACPAGVAGAACSHQLAAMCVWAGGLR